MLDWKLLAGAAGIVAAVVFVIWLIFFCARRIREHLKGRELDAMEGHDFEYFCADLLEDHGFKSVEVSRNIRKTPDITQSYRTAGRNQDKSKPGGKTFSIVHLQLSWNLKKYD